MNSLTIIFLGLIALSPNSDGSVTALAVDATNNKGVPCKNAGAWEMPAWAHHAALLVPKVSMNGALPSGCISNSQGPTGYLEFDLEGAEVTVDTRLPSRAVERISGHRKETGGQPNLIPTADAEVQDYSWILKLKDLVKGPGADPALGRLNPVCVDEGQNPLEPKSGAKACPLAGRLRLDRGTLSTECIIKNHKSYVTWVATTDGKENLGDAFSAAEGTQAKIDDIPAGTSIHVTLRKFGEASPYCTMKLKAGEDHKLWMVNQEAIRAAKCVADENPHFGAFLAFYKLTAYSCPAEGCMNDCRYVKPGGPSKPFTSPHCTGLEISQ